MLSERSLNSWVFDTESEPGSLAAALLWLTCVCPSAVVSYVAQDLEACGSTVPQAQIPHMYRAEPRGNERATAAADPTRLRPGAWCNSSRCVLVTVASA